MRRSRVYTLTPMNVLRAAAVAILLQAHGASSFKPIHVASAQLRLRGGGADVDEVLPPQHSHPDAFPDIQPGVSQQHYSEPAEYLTQPAPPSSPSRAKRFKRPVWLKECLGEAIGSAIITGVGTAAVASAVTTGEQTGLWQVAVVFGWIIAASIASLSHVSGAQFNPAISIATHLLQPGSMTWRKVGRYFIAQLVGAMLGAYTTLAAYAAPIASFEYNNGFLRGQIGSRRSAAIVGLFYPNPNVQILRGVKACFSCVPGAMALEALGTGILAFVVFSLGHPRNKSLGNSKALMPIVIGFTIACIISFLAPLTMAGLNPARWLGPHLLLMMLGWGKHAFPNEGFLASVAVYALGPIVGALMGGWLAIELGDRDEEDLEHEKQH